MPGASPRAGCEASSHDGVCASRTASSRGVVYVLALLFVLALPAFMRPAGRGVEAVGREQSLASASGD
jgi:hypothetical protein